MDATVDTSVILIKKNNSNDNVIKVNNVFEMKQKRLLKNIPWTFTDEQTLDLKDKILSQGTIIKDINDITIKFGIKTGKNEVFIIDKKTRDFLLHQDRNNESIIKPVIRGRDVSKWRINYQNIYLICTKNGIDVKNQYPSIYEYLLQFEEGLSKRYDQGDHWSNLRNCSYYDLFEKPRIVYSEIAQNPKFTYDNKYYPEATTFILSSKSLNIKYILALMNSNVLFWVFRFLCTTLSEKGIRYKKKFIEELPLILDIPSNLEDNICEHVDNILKYYETHHESDSYVNEEEKKLNKLIYKIYNISDSEKEIIERELI